MVVAGPVPNDLNSSASQVKTFMSCARKWAFEKLYLIKQPQKHHFAIGGTLHAIAERYLSKETTTWEGLFPPGWDKHLITDVERQWMRRMAEEAVSKGVWRAKPGITIEHPVAYLVGNDFRDSRGMPLLAKASTYQDKNGVRRVAKLTSLVDGRPLPTGWNKLPPFVGFMDYYDPHYAPRIAEVADHKTAKNKRYVLSPAKLALDTQLLSYAATPIALDPSIDTVHLRHNVLLKDPEATEPVFMTEAEVGIDAVRNNWTDIILASERMVSIRAMAPAIVIHGHPEERARNFHFVRSAIDDGKQREACEAYGGCPYKDTCLGRSTVQQMTTRMDREHRESINTKPPHTPTQSFGPLSSKPHRTGPLPVISWSAPCSVHLSQPAPCSRSTRSSTCWTPTMRRCSTAPWSPTRAIAAPPTRS